MKLSGSALFAFALSSCSGEAATSSEALSLATDLNRKVIEIESRLEEASDQATEYGYQLEELNGWVDDLEKEVVRLRAQVANAEAMAMDR